MGREAGERMWKGKENGKLKEQERRIRHGKWRNQTGEGDGVDSGGGWREKEKER